MTLPHLSHEEILRYSRHLLLPEVGVEGQRALKGARVLTIGAGGLGSPIALYLAAAGVGTIGIVEFDVVDLTNLQRQVLHGTSQVGRSKLESAASRLGDLNPHVQVVRHPVQLSSANALEIFRGYDIVIDGSDNFPTLSTTRRCCLANRWSMAASSASRARSRSSMQLGDRATAASTASPRRRDWCRAARRAGSSASCRGS
jgi:adenylyltransferase/sulfurtransferase